MTFPLLTPAELAQLEAASGLPTPQPGHERGDDDHLKCNVNADGGEADDGVDRVLQPVADARDQSRNDARHEEGGHRHLGARRELGERGASDDHLVAREREQQATGGRLQREQA